MGAAVGVFGGAVIAVAVLAVGTRWWMAAAALGLAAALGWSVAADLDRDANAAGQQQSAQRSSATERPAPPGTVSASRLSEQPASAAPAEPRVRSADDPGATVVYDGWAEDATASMATAISETPSADDRDGGDGRDGRDGGQGLLAIDDLIRHILPIQEPQCGACASFEVVDSPVADTARWFAYVRVCSRCGASTSPGPRGVRIETLARPRRDSDATDHHEQQRTGP